MRELAKVVGFLFLLTFVVAGALGGLHLATRERVAENDLVRYQRGVLEAMGLSITDRREILETYERLTRLEPPSGSGRVIYLKDRDVMVPGYEVAAMPFIGPGVWGDIHGVISMTTDLTTIVGLSILDQNETPGLGGRITETEFLAQFAGERVGEQGLTLRRGLGDTDATNASIDGISGATGSSRALHAIVNETIAALRAKLSAGVLS